MSALDDLSFLVALAQEAQMVGDLQRARIILEDAIRAATCCQMEDVFGPYGQFLDGILVQYGLLLKQIDPKAGLDIWKSLAKRFKEDQFKKTKAIKEQLECLCGMEKWYLVIDLSTVALRELEELSPRRSDDPNIIVLAQEILTLIELAKTKVDEVGDNEVDPEWLPQECHTWATGAKAQPEKMPKSKKKKGKMKVINRKGYNEEQLEASASARVVPPAMTARKAEELDAVAGPSRAVKSKEPEPSTSGEMSDKKDEKDKKKKKEMTTTDGSQNKKKKEMTTTDGSQDKKPKILPNSHQGIKKKTFSASDDKIENVTKLGDKDKKKGAENEPAISGATTTQQQKQEGTSKDGNRNKRAKRLAKLRENASDVSVETVSSEVCKQQKENVTKSSNSGKKKSEDSTPSTTSAKTSGQQQKKVNLATDGSPNKQLKENLMEVLAKCEENTTNVSGFKLVVSSEAKPENVKKSNSTKKSKETLSSTTNKQQRKTAHQAKDGSQNKRLRRLAKAQGNGNNVAINVSQAKRENVASYNGQKKSGHAQQEPSSADRSSGHKFPLEKTHNFILGCPRCSKEVNSKWTVEAGHSGCAESVWFVRKKQDSAKLWIKIRNRQSLVCYNTYKACLNFPDAPCHRNDREKCCFAHSQEEIKIWNAEKFHGFNIEAFKLENKSRKTKAKNGGDKQNKVVVKPAAMTPAQPSVSERFDRFLKVYQGFFRYTQDIVVYTDEGDDIRIRKPRDGAQRSELCRDSFCLNENCVLAHSEVERDFWLLAADTEFTFENICKRLSPPTRTGPAPLENPLDEYYCNFCFKQCNGPLQLERHCNSKSHMDKVTVEDGDQWQHRQPPPGLQLKLCAKHVMKTCRYSDAPQDFNLCIEAHSQEELEEWMQRRDVRHQKMRLAKRKDLLSYVVKLEQRLEESPTLSKQMKEKLKNVTVETSKALKQALQDKGNAITWKFKIFSKDMNLRNVALLKDKDRFWFQLDHRGKSHVQHLTESDLETYKVAATEEKGNACYEITVRFKGGAFGTYRQWVIFDFGKMPYLVKRLEVDVGEKLHEEMERLRDSLKTDHWTAESVDIVPFGNPTIVTRTEDDFMKKLQIKYKLQPGEVSSNVVSGVLNKDNYVQKMHDLLFMEETCQLQMMARFTSKLTAKISQSVILSDNRFLSAPGGLKLAKLMLTKILACEGRAGYLIQRNCSYVLLRPKRPSGYFSSKAYQAPVVTKRTIFGTNGVGHDHVYVCVDENFLKAAKVDKDEVEIEVWVQFEMNRDLFCAMHYAVENISTSLDLLFPRSPPRTDQQKLKAETATLNAQQCKALNEILNHRKGDPMLVLYGAFGTGKTRTLSCVTMQLRKTDAIQKKGKILICTLSNSAADLFVHQIDELNKCEHEKVEILRIYQAERHMNTINEKVRKYMLTEEDRHGFSHVKMPSRKDIENVDVIITTVATSLELVKLGLKGKFTHILIDEAGQTLEANLLMPLLLATNDTCIVLAGDVMQMSPPVYNADARQLKVSLLQRMYDRYQMEQKFLADQDQGHHRSVYLNENYRNDELILKFLSTVIYVNQSPLVWSSGIKTSSASLRLHVVNGCERPGNGMSFYNVEEVCEVTHLLMELDQNWPAEWGKKDLSNVVVTSVYLDQIDLIRKYLRGKGLGKVTVTSMENLQGCQYIAVIISTVHGPNPSEEVADNLGFLSDEKLVNTSISRAKYCAIVVGNAEALCTRGQNIFLWYTFLLLASSRDGLVVRSGLDPHDFVLHIESRMRDANTRVPLLDRRRTPDTRSTSSASASRSDRSSQDRQDSNESPSPSNDTNFEDSDSDTDIDEATLDSCVSDDEYFSLEDESEEDNDSDDLVDDTDLILSTFRGGKGVEMLLPMLTNKSNDFAAGAFVPRNNLERITGVRVLKCLTYDQSEGVAKIEIPTKSKVKQKKKPQWRPFTTALDSSELQRKKMAVGADDVDDDDDDPNDDDDDDSEDEYDLRELARMRKLLAEREDCKKCLLNMYSQRRIMAVILEDEAMKGKIVIIRNRRYCKRAFDGDDVVVQLKTLDGEFVVPLQGKVVGVVRRNMTMRYRTFVCRAEPTNPSLMIPLAPELPPFVSLRPKPGAKEGHVTVFKTEKKKKILGFENVPMDSHCPRLYIVMYLKWNSGKALPLGVVVGILPIGDDIESGRAILQRCHNVPRRILESSKLARSCSSQFPENYMNDKTFPTRLDLRDKKIFTIDDATTRDLDDALHVEICEDGTITVGVHIADVSHFVKRGTDIDNEAFKRGTSYYPANEPPIHMLPGCLGTDLCSLLPEKDRLAVSVLFRMSKNGDIKSVSRHLTVIRSVRRFDYEEVEAILDDRDTIEEEIKIEWKVAMTLLYHMAKIFAMRRKGRVGFLEIEEYEDAPKARMLIEEWMVTTNKHVAEHLLKKYPDRVPLRRQMVPATEELEDWKRKYQNQIPFSFSLQRIAHLLKEEGVIQAHGRTTVHVLRNVWEVLVAHHDEYQMLCKLARTITTYPDQFCALKNWHRIQSRAVYHCSGSGSDHHHFSLGTDAYTHFTSPIRRYIDIVVHRLLKADIENQTIDYTSADIAKICIHCTGTQAQAKAFEREFYLLIEALGIKESPKETYVIANEVNTREIEATFPTVKHMPRSLRVLPFAFFDLKENPCYEYNNHLATNKVIMTYEQRIYHRGETRAHAGDGAHLDSKQFTVEIPGVLWKCLTNAIVASNIENAFAAFQVISHYLDSRQDRPFVTEVSSESAVRFRRRQEITFKRYVEPGDVLKVQLATRIDKGLIKPCVQLVKLTPSFHICLEHNRDPINSFASLRLSSDPGRNLAQYITHWLALLTMESAYSVAKTPGEKAHVYNVPIEWELCADGVVHGRVKLDKTYCKERYLLFSPDVLYGVEGEKIEEDDSNWVDETHTNIEGANCKDWQVTKFGFMCVKFNISGTNSKPMIWVGHFHITDVLIEEEVVLYLKLNHSSYQFPSHLLEKKGSKTPCTIHWLNKPTPDVRTESAVLGLSDSNHESLPVLISQREIRPGQAFSEETDIHIETDVVKPPNVDQALALRTALHNDNRFVLIWGPPGTGKSVTGVQLAYLFAQNNEPEHQVLYCGPSNKSVNVVTAKLKLLDIKVIRIFSEALIHKSYPLPNFPQMKVVDGEALGEHRDVALHELVRLEGRPFADEIAAYDRKFRLSPTEATIEDLREYKKKLIKAYMRELGTAQVVLCTCGASGNGLYQKAFKKCIQQVIIDECGMCTEPETLIPLVACNPSKVVLIGDHKQLRPVMMCPTARKSGLDRTLFEEYADNSVMLHIQYRMHKVIQDFPSAQFYRGQLQCGVPAEQTKEVRPFRHFWPAGPRTPIAFCHVEGEEISQSVTTGTANIGSCANMAEVSQVVKVIHALNNGHVELSKIAVLSPYRLQVAKIKEKLRERHLEDVKVSTITTSQGSEWEYVILSTVRSLPPQEIEENPWPAWCQEKMGFLTDPHQVNVGITRAKDGLIIIGNQNLLKCDEVWSNLLEYYARHRAITDDRSFP